MAAEFDLLIAHALPASNSHLEVLIPNAGPLWAQVNHCALFMTTISVSSLLERACIANLQIAIEMLVVLLVTLVMSLWSLAATRKCPPDSAVRL